MFSSFLLFHFISFILRFTSEKVALSSSFKFSKKHGRRGVVIRTRTIMNSGTLVKESQKMKGAELLIYVIVNYAEQ